MHNYLILFLDTASNAFIHPKRNCKLTNDSKAELFSVKEADKSNSDLLFQKNERRRTDAPGAEEPGFAL